MEKLDFGAIYSEKDNELILIDSPKHSEFEFNQNLRIYLSDNDKYIDIEVPDITYTQIINIDDIIRNKIAVFDTFLNQIDYISTLNNNFKYHGVISRETHELMMFQYYAKISDGFFFLSVPLMEKIIDLNLIISTDNTYIIYPRYVLLIFNEIFKLQGVNLNE